MALKKEIEKALGSELFKEKLSNIQFGEFIPKNVYVKLEQDFNNLKSKESEELTKIKTEKEDLEKKLNEAEKKIEVVSKGKDGEKSILEKELAKLNERLDKADAEKKALEEKQKKDAKFNKFKELALGKNEEYGGLRPSEVDILEAKFYKRMDELDDNLTGAEDILKEFKQNKKHLFGELKLSGEKPKGGVTYDENYNGANPFKKGTLNLTRQAEILEKNPKLAERLKLQAKG